VCLHQYTHSGAECVWGGKVGGVVRQPDFWPLRRPACSSKTPPRGAEDGQQHGVCGVCGVCGAVWGSVEQCGAVWSSVEQML
jgi:hypothetical protein